MRSVIVDCDAGIDDAFALMVLLAEEHRNPYKIVGVTCTYGNTSLNNVTRNVLFILESMNRADIPVYRGAEASLTHGSGVSNFHGGDGLGDQNFPEPLQEIQEEHAVSALNRVTSENEDVSIMCLGPLTNLALALRYYPSLCKKIKDLWIMGGNTTAIANVRNTTAEFNFQQDPVAASIVFETIQCPTTILPWEPCKTAPITREWRFETLGAATTKHIKILNAAERELNAQRPMWNPCDAFLAALFVNKNVIVAERKVKLAVETQGTYTKGQCVLLQSGETNTRVIDQIDYQIVQDIFLATAQFIPR